MSRQEFIDRLQSKWISRKLLVFIIASVALFLGKITSSDWVIISSIYISLESATTIAEKLYKSRQSNQQNIE
jgi:hypothetical protein